MPSPGAVMEVRGFPALTDDLSGFTVENHPVCVQMACGGARSAHALQGPWAAGAGDHQALPSMPVPGRSGVSSLAGSDDARELKGGTRHQPQYPGLSLLQV